MRRSKLRILGKQSLLDELTSAIEVLIRDIHFDQLLDQARVLRLDFRCFSELRSCVGVILLLAENYPKQVVRFSPVWEPLYLAAQKFDGLISVSRPPIRLYKQAAGLKRFPLILH